MPNSTSLKNATQRREMYILSKRGNQHNHLNNHEQDSEMYNKNVKEKIVRVYD